MPATASWALLLQFAGLALSLLALWVGLLLIAFGRGPAALLQPDSLPPAALVWYGTGLYAILLATAWFVWRRAGQRVTVAFSAAKITEGWAMGLVGLALLVVIEAAVGWIAVRPGARFDPIELLSAALVGLLFALSEEALFRGFVLGLLLRDLPRRRAIVVSAAIFAAAHFLHPVDPQTMGLGFLGLVCAGALLACVRLRSGSLWSAVGLHASWVWYVTASGQQGWWDSRQSLWTGGGSPAAGLLGPILLALTYLWVRRRYPAVGSARS